MQGTKLERQLYASKISIFAFHSIININFLQENYYVQKIGLFGFFCFSAELSR